MRAAATPSPHRHSSTLHRQQARSLGPVERASLASGVCEQIMDCTKPLLVHEVMTRALVDNGIACADLDGCCPVAAAVVHGRVALAAGCVASSGGAWGLAQRHCTAGLAALTAAAPAGGGGGAGCSRAGCSGSWLVEDLTLRLRLRAAKCRHALASVSPQMSCHLMMALHTSDIFLFRSERHHSQHGKRACP